MAYRVLRVGRMLVKKVVTGDERDGEPNGRNAVWAKLAGEDGKYRMVSRKGAGRVENLISACACFGGNLFLFLL